LSTSDVSQDCPPIGLFDFTSDQVKVLSAAVQELAEKVVTSIAIHALPGIVAIDGITLTSASSGKNAGLSGLPPDFDFFDLRSCYNKTTICL